MEYSDAQIKEYIRKVVSETKSTAHVDTGFLRRSIRGNWFKGMATFREVFYGAYNDNAKLVENAKRIMPSDIPWRVIFVDEDGRETEVEAKTRTGRTISRKQVTSKNVSTENIKLLQKLIKANNAKKAKDSAGEGNRKVDEEAS